MGEIEDEGSRACVCVEFCSGDRIGQVQGVALACGALATGSFADPRNVALMGPLYQVLGEPAGRPIRGDAELRTLNEQPR